MATTHSNNCNNNPPREETVTNDTKKGDEDEMTKKKRNEENTYASPLSEASTPISSTASPTERPSINNLILHPAATAADVCYWLDTQPFHLVILLPSLSFNQKELDKIPGIPLYEQRFLYHLLLLAKMKRLNLVMLTSSPVPEEIVDYYLNLCAVPEVTVTDMRQRLTMISVGDTRSLPLTEKVLGKPLLVRRLRAMVEQFHGSAALLCWVASPFERQLKTLLGCALLGASPEATEEFGTKSGSRKLFAKMKVPHSPGTKFCRSSQCLAEEIAKHCHGRKEETKMVVKIDVSFSGEGNAILIVPKSPTVDTVYTALKSMTFCSDSASWESYEEQINSLGAIAEEFIISSKGKAEVSGQGIVQSNGQVQCLSTHTQILNNQVYLGCRFPVEEPNLRAKVEEATTLVGKGLAHSGAIDHYGVDFIQTDSGELYALEINLRHLGTTHPFMTTLFLTGGEKESGGRLFLKDGSHEERVYISSDNISNKKLYCGITSEDLMHLMVESGLSYSSESKTGVVLTMHAACSEYGKFGATCIAKTMKEAQLMLDELQRVVDELATSVAVELGSPSWKQPLGTVGVDISGLSHKKLILQLGEENIQNAKERIFISVAVHETEVCGIIAVNEMLEKGLLTPPPGSSLFVILANPKALLVADENATGDSGNKLLGTTMQQRSSTNLNRCFTNEIIMTKEPHDEEERHLLCERAREYWTHLLNFQPTVFIDIHSSSNLAPPFALPLNNSPSSVEFAECLPVTGVIEGFEAAKGTNIDYLLAQKGHFPHNLVAAAVICGRHDAHASINAASSCIQSTFDFVQARLNATLTSQKGYRQQ